MKAISASELRGNWATLLPSWNSDDSIDRSKLTLQIDKLIDFEVDGIYSNGTAGEFYASSESDFDISSEVLADRCESAGMPFQIGVSHMSAQVSFQRLKRAVQYRPSAFQLILPDWFPVSVKEAIEFLKKMAEAADGVPLVLYNPPHAKRVLSIREIAGLSESIPSLIGVKVAGGDDHWYAEMRKNLAHISVFIPGHDLASGLRKGAQGSYSNISCLHPGAAQRWAFQARTDAAAALELESRIHLFLNRHILPFITEDEYCNAACDRLLALIGGWADIGDRMRWPYRSIPAGEADRLRPIAEEILPEFVSR